MSPHEGLAAGRWTTLSLAEQLGHAGSEVQRTIRAWEAGRRGERFERALERALELLDLTARDARWRGARRREILRLREEFCGLFFGTATAGTARWLEAYFLRFGVLARRVPASIASGHG